MCRFEIQGPPGVLVGLNEFSFISPKMRYMIDVKVLSWWFGHLELKGLAGTIYSLFFSLTDNNNSSGSGRWRCCSASGTRQHPEQSAPF